MKRKIVIILLISIIPLGGVFGQTVKVGSGTLNISGRIATGVFLDTDNVSLLDNSNAIIPENTAYYGSDGGLRQWAITDFSTGTGHPVMSWVQLRYATGNVGIRTTFMALNANLGSGDVFYPYEAYGYMYLFNRSVIVRGGLMINQPLYGTGSLDGGFYHFDGPGIQVEFEPFRLDTFKELSEKIGKFTIGTFLVLPAKGNTDTVYDADWKAVPNGGALTIKNVLNETAFGFRWEHPWFLFKTSYKLDSYADNGSIKHRNSNTLWSAANEDDKILFNFRFTGVDQLKLLASGNIGGLRNWAARGRGFMLQELEYSLINVPVPYLFNGYLGLRAFEKIYGYDMKECADWDFSLKPYIQLSPYIGYKTDFGLKAALEFGIAFGHNVTNDAVPNTNQTSQKIVYEDLNFYIKPNILYQIPNTGLTVRAWYKFSNVQYGDLNEGSAFSNRAQSFLPLKQDKSGPVESITAHQVAIQFSWMW
jgi:hypothetical protein